MNSASRRPLVIIGNGEIAAMACEYFKHDSGYTPVGFAIGSDYIKGDSFEGLPVVSLSDLASTWSPVEVDAFVAIGDAQLNRVRTRHLVHVKALGYRIASYVSSRCFRWHNVVVGENCLILEGNTLQPFVEIGDNVILWSGNHIGHRSRIEDNVFITSHVVVSGFCSIGAFSYIGVNASIANGVTIAEDNFIAMGAVVGQSTQADTIYQGNPAEPRKIAATRFHRVKPA